MHRLWRWIGDLLIKLGVLAAFALLAFAVWITNFPDAPLVEQAKGWPALGPLVARLHRVYRPPPVDPGAGPAPGEGGDEAGAQRGEAPTPMVSSARAGKRFTTYKVWVKPGTVMREAPTDEAAPVGELTLYANLGELERRGEWARVRFRGLEGWVRAARAQPGLVGVEPGEDPPLGRAPDPPGPLQPRAPDPERLAAARAALGPDARADRLGPYAFYTDNDNVTLHRRLARLATELDDRYAARFGRRPLGTPRAAVVLYDRRDGYLRFHEAFGAPDRPGTGHAIGAIAALWVNGADLGRVSATFVHELVHLINRRALGPALPPWLDEGIAEAMDTSKIDPDGTLHPTRLGGRRWQVGEIIHYDGGVAALHQLRRASVPSTSSSVPGIFSIREILALDATAFLAENVELRYALAGFWIRYLLDGDDGRYAAAFQAFLDDVAGGLPPSPERLRRRLDASWPELETSFQAWLGSLSLLGRPQ